MLTAIVDACVAFAFVVAIVLLARALRNTSIVPLENRLSKLEQRFDDHDYAHMRLSRSIDNLHVRMDRIPDEVVSKLSGR